MKVGADGWLSGVRRIRSPNCDARPQGVRIRLMLCRINSLPPGEFGDAAVAQLFTNTLDCTAHPYYTQLVGMKVSAHFFIRRGGDIIQFVPCGKRAWHAGVSSWQGRSACNDFSLGVELEGTDELPFTPQQYAALARLTRRLCHAYPIGDIVGHADVAPGRKTDPGAHFDWPSYRAAARLT